MMKTLGIAVLVLAGARSMLAADVETAAPATQPKTQPTKELKLDLGGNVALKLLQIPAGKFLMGSPDTEYKHDPNETQHEVTISKPFYMGITHVTVDQFAAFVKDSGYQTDAEREGWSIGMVVRNGNVEGMKINGCCWRVPTIDQKGDHPVVQVSWNDARAFCDWLSRKSGKTVALPTEAQWEYACRAGTTTAYIWGVQPDDGKGWANCADQSYKALFAVAPPGQRFFNWDDGFACTSPVGSFKPNAFGLYDMVGNALQWCQDSYGSYGKEAVTDPTGPSAVLPEFANNPVRIQRGGDWRCFPFLCRSASRQWSLPNLRNECSGFRVVVPEGAN